MLIRLVALLSMPLLGACGGGEAGPATPARAKPEATVARWVKTGDCGLFTDSYVSAGHDSVAEGRRACQVQADKTPVKPYRVETTRVRAGEAAVVLALRDGTRMTFWLVPRGTRDWRIDGYEERRSRDGTIGALEVMTAFERRTGERLARLPKLSPPTYQTLGLADVIRAGAGRQGSSGRFHQLVEKFGVFTIHVTADVAEARWIVRGVPVDEHGLYWRRRGDGEPRRWGAEKLYGNVVLSWTGETAKRTDHTFDRVDAILRETLGRARD
jgi:hypothetical protein